MFHFAYVTFSLALFTLFDKVAIRRGSKRKCCGFLSIVVRPIELFHACFLGASSYCWPFSISFILFLNSHSMQVHCLCGLFSSIQLYPVFIYLIILFSDRNFVIMWLCQCHRDKHTTECARIFFINTLLRSNKKYRKKQNHIADKLWMKIRAKPKSIHTNNVIIMNRFFFICHFLSVSVSRSRFYYIP